MATIFVVTFKYPAAAAGALLCTFGLEQWAMSRSDFFFMNQTLTNYMTGALVTMAVGFRFLKGEKLIMPLSKMFFVVTALMLWAGISSMWAIDTGDTWNRFVKRLPNLLMFWLGLMMTVRSYRDLRASFNLMMTVGAFLLTIFLLFTEWQGRQIQLERGAAIGSIISDRGNPLAVATLAGQVGLAALLMNFRGVERIWQILRWVLIGMAITITFQSGSRGQLFAMVFAGAAFLPYSRRVKNVANFVGLVIGGVVFLALVSVLFDVMVGGSTRWTPDEFFRTYSGTRVDTSLVLLRAWLDAGPMFWLIGLGSNASYSIPGLNFYPHLVLLEVLGELGLVGFALLFAIPTLVGVAMYQLWPFVKDSPERRGVLAALGAMFLFDVILSFKQGSLLMYGSTFAFACIIARLATMEKLGEVPAVADVGSPDAASHELDDSESTPYLPDAFSPVARS
jgi:hypothetical protein